MAVRLGVPDTVADAPLARRIAWTIGARLAFLALSLGAVAALNVARGFDVGSVTIQAVLATLTVAFALTIGYAVVLRLGRGLERLAVGQLAADQLIVTVLVYLTGGAASGATSFYGVTCLEGAFLLGLGGAALAAAAGALLYASLVGLLYAGWLEPPADQGITLYRVSGEEASFYIAVNVLVLVVVTLLASYLAERVRRAGGRIVAAEARADQAERMAALGRLTTGLAHEIRNPLGSISGSVELLRANPALDEEDRKLCDIIRREADRLNDLVTDMMDVARPKAPDITDVDLSAVAREVVALAGSVGRGSSDVGVGFVGEEQVCVRADPAQMRQIVWNLVRNAVQASSPGDAVQVGVETDAAGLVTLWVEDQGPGLTPEAREHLFDAFFTTRAHGTGIGLALVKRIADDHGFEIEVSGDQGRGARFTVRMGLCLRAPPG
jgi:two-component system, NtrC family, sensor histidine kinase HydH